MRMTTQSWMGAVLAVLILAPACMNGPVDDGNSADVMLELGEQVSIPPVAGSAQTGGGCLYTISATSATLKNVAKSDVVGDSVLQGINVETLIISYSNNFFDMRTIPLGVTIDPGTSKSVPFIPFDLAGLNGSINPAGQSVDLTLQFFGHTFDGHPVSVTGGAPAAFNACIGAGSSGDSDSDGIPADDGDGVADPCTGGNNVGCDDNCPSDANPTQADGDNDGIGDACDPS